MIYTFYDEENKLGFGHDTEIDVYIKYVCEAGWLPSWDDPGGAPECIINSWKINTIASPEGNINLSTLSPEKLEEVNDVIALWIDDKDVHESCFQDASDRQER